jgi:signal transduction histidine kinase
MKLKQKKPNGIGLRVMRYRSDLIGGDLTIRAAPKHGVQVTCRFPCPVVAKPETKLSKSLRVA